MQYFFVVSQQNQVRRLIELAKTDKDFLLKYRGKTSVLHLNWDDDPMVGELLSELVKICQIRETVAIKVPKQAAAIGSYIKRYFLKNYRNFLESNPDLKSLVVFSYAGHYSYLLQLAEERNIELVLVEEGLGTYSAFTHTMKEFPAWRIFAKAAYQLLRFGFATIPVSFIRCLNEIIPKPKLPALPSSGFRDFNIVYCGFPKAAGLLFPSAQIKSTEPKVPSGQVKIGKNSLFLGQTYPLSEDEIRKLLELLVSKGSGLIFLKHHPRLGDSQRAPWDQLLMKPEFSTVRLVEHNMPSELLMSELNIKEVFSLTSSALITTASSNKNIKSVSLAAGLINSFPEPSGVLGRVKRDLELLEAFSRSEELAIYFD